MIVDPFKRTYILSLKATCRKCKGTGKIWQNEQQFGFGGYIDAGYVQCTCLVNQISALNKESYNKVKKHNNEVSKKIRLLKAKIKKLERFYYSDMTNIKFKIRKRK